MNHSKHPYRHSDSVTENSQFCFLSQILNRSNIGAKIPDTRYQSAKRTTALPPSMLGRNAGTCSTNYR